MELRGLAGVPGPVPGPGVEPILEHAERGRRAVARAWSGSARATTISGTRPGICGLARIALRSAFTGQQVTVSDRDLLAVASGSDPEVMRRVAGSILAGLDQIPAGQRPVLLATLGA